jgi:hypothetical protein
MREEREIRAEIAGLEKSSVLNEPPAKFEVNAFKAAIQIECKSRLAALYWVLGELRPFYACDGVQSE